MICRNYHIFHDLVSHEKRREEMKEQKESRTVKVNSHKRHGLFHVAREAIFLIRGENCES